MSGLQPTIFLVDDDPSVLKAVSRVLRSGGFDVITYDSSRKFLAHCNPATHGCVVLDIAMPGLNGLEVQQALAAKGASLPIVFLTGRGDIPTSVRAMKHGAVDFLTKPVQHGDLEAAVHAAIAKDRAQWRERVELAEIRRRLATLTRREYEILGHVISGQLNKQAGAELGIAEKTVKVHRARVMEKMQVRSVAELVHLAERAGIGGVGASFSNAVLDQSPISPGAAAC